VLTTLATRGIDVRSQVLARVDRSPDEVVAETGGSSYGFEWDGWRASAKRAALTNPLPGLHLIGASMHPGSTIPYAAWGAAHVAERLGKA
jgi:UDP-galactopyranose mutase